MSGTSGVGGARWYETAVLWMFVIDLGIALGAGIYEHRVVLREWLVTAPDGTLHWNAEAARAADTGRRFWGFVTTGPLTLLTVASLVLAWRMDGLGGSAAMRTWWLVAAGAALADRALTFGYFIPTMVGLMGAADDAGSVAVASRWVGMNHVRHGLIAAAWVAALAAFSRAGGR